MNPTLTSTTQDRAAPIRRGTVVTSSASREPVHIEAAGMTGARAGERDDSCQNSAEQREKDDRLNHTPFSPSSD
jgi:hypothetical protein